MRPPIDTMHHFQQTGCWYYVKYSFKCLINRIWKLHCWINQLSCYGQDAMNVGIFEIYVCDRLSCSNTDLPALRIVIVKQV